MRIRAAVLAASCVVMAVGVRAPQARAETPVTEVGGGGFGVSVVSGGVNLNPMPVGVIPKEGGSFYASADDKFVGTTDFGKAVVYGFGTLTPGPNEPYAFVDSRVGHVSIAGIHELTFAYVKTFCEWDPATAEHPEQAYGMTFVYYEGGVGGVPIPETVDVPLPDGGHYVMNEQLFESFEGRQVIVVNGIHAYLADGTEYIVAQSSCDPLRPPLFGTGTDTRTALAPSTAGVFDMWSNAVIAREDCFDGVDNNGDGNIDWDGGPNGANPDPACQYEFCSADGLDHFAGTPAEGIASFDVEYRLLPTGVLALDDAIRQINCNVVVPAEDLIDSTLGP
jgi:hypothetical protein